MDIKIIVATHKKYTMPQDEIYVPVQVGAEKKKNCETLDFGYQNDDTGDNISVKNNAFCELTGLYWAWKNLKYDYVGLVHYRRHFCLKKKKGKKIDSALNSNEVQSLIEKYKVILPKKRRYYIETLYSHYKHTLYVDPLDKTREIVAELYPEYVSVYDKVLHQRSGHMFNMFIMSKELVNGYCTWLFDILFKLEKEMGDREYDSFHARFYGRISEILLNVWVRFQKESKVIDKSDIKSIPYFYMEKINWLKKGSSFLKAKFFKKTYEKTF